MSAAKVHPLIDGWVGYGDQGADILLSTGTPVDADHPVVQARPELFSEPFTDEAQRGSEPEPEPRRAPRKASKSKAATAPRADADG